MRQFYVYILSSKSRNLYTGVTNDLVRRVYQHSRGEHGFTARYKINRLVYYEISNAAINAIEREKQIKSWTRSKRIALIESMNPRWSDLADGWYERQRRDG